MTSLNVLFASLDLTKAAQATRLSEISDEIQTELNAKYADWTALQAAVEALESSTGVGYTYGQHGEVCSWIRFEALADVPKRERQYLESYVEDNYCMRVDFENDVLIQNLGEDEITIQAYHGRDNGVYQSNALIISPSEYVTEDGEDVGLRNKLIEEHMERTGCFPGVFEVSYHGDITPVNTSKET